MLLPEARLYGGFFALDASRLALIFLLSLLCSVGLWLLLGRKLKPGRAVQVLAAGVVAFVVLFMVVFHLFMGYPVFAIRSFFELP